MDGKFKGLGIRKLFGILELAAIKLSLILGIGPFRRNIVGKRGCIVPEWSLGFGLDECRFRLRLEENTISHPNTVHRCISRK